MTPAVISHRRLVVVLAALSAIGPFSIDTYLPSFPDIAASLGASPIEVQQTLTVYLVAFGVMMLWHGAISDALGRKPVILAGLAVFAASSCACALVDGISQLWWWRTLQGVSAGAGIVVGRAIVRDFYPGEGPEARQLMSHISMTFALAPAVAPIIGGFLQAAFGWRSIFVFLAVLSGSLWLACWRWLPETLPAERRQSLHPGALSRAYARVLSDPAFVAASAALAFNFSAFFVYVLSAPVFLMQHLRLPETGFGWFFVPAMVGLTGGAWLSGRLAERHAPLAVLRLAYGLMALAATGNLVLNLLVPPALPWQILPLPLYTFGMAMAMPNLTLLALDRFPERRGLAASCQGFIHTGFNGLAAGVVAPLVWATTLRLSACMAALLACGAAATLLHRAWARPRTQSPP